MMLRRKTLAMLAALSLAAGAAACGDTDDPSPTPLPDAGEDVGPDAELDVEPDPDVEEDVGPDADVDPEPAVAPTPGDLVITEVMKQPTEVSAVEGQWVELFNTSDAELELEGCLLGSSELDEGVLIAESLTVVSGGYLTLAASANAGFDADLVLSGLRLSEAEGSVTLECDGETITEVAYDAGESYPAVAGASLSRDPAFNGATDNSGDYWCAATAAYNGADLGTPGAANPSCDGGSGDTGSAQIADLLANGPGDDGKMIEGVTVTYVRPLVGSESAGFFVQASAGGPALFVAVAEGEVMPVEVNDVVDFRVLTVDSFGSSTWADSFDSLNVNAGAGNREALITDLTGAADLITDLDSYAHRLVRAELTITGELETFAGAGHQAYSVSNGAVGGDDDVKLRMPTELRESLGLAVGCDVDVTATPLWRFDATAQFMAYNSSELSVENCPALSVVSATATSITTVQLVLSRALGPINSDGSEFTIAGLAVTAAEANGPMVTLTTAEQTSMADYTVELADTLTDIFGDTIPADASASFTGFSSLSVVFSEIMTRFTGGGGDPGEYIELFNSGASAFDLSGCLLTRDAATNNEMVLADGLEIPAGGYVLFVSSDTIPELTSAQTLELPLGNSGGTYALSCASQELDRVTVTSSTVALGISYQKDVTKLGTPNPDGAAPSDSWCLTPEDAANQFATFETELKYGTPGTANLACP
ncbi:lamin tail domain-containing protein [Bradymonadaceae bacterium TMQ3]|nr:lamin tail domain-containing protein [Bradymonadaceae bacterium TMQ3]TXC76024.1 lamin tail domain-containing protein [Bradymonadales bacterium TMQ1]